MQRFIDLGAHLSLTTLILLAGALVAVLAAVMIARRRRALTRRGLPPLVFDVRDPRPVDFRPASFRHPPPPTPPPPHPSPAEAERTTYMPRVERPVEYFPGRLEIESGHRRGETIRFRRTHGNSTRITLGRGDGPPDTHIKLPAETVSRHHASMQFENGRWRITNLSRTNPTIVNGEELIAAEGGRWLEDGDVIEMGEIVLRFRAD
jgi:hypothetical protein